MPLRKNNTRTFHRTLYSGELQSIILLKRNDDQQQGTVRKIKLFQCRKSRQTKSGEPIQGDMSSSFHTTWHLPRIELDRVGVAYINAADRIIDYEDEADMTNGVWWEPESNTNITVQLFQNHINVECLRIDPPKGQTLQS